MIELNELRRMAGVRDTILGAEIYKLCDAIERELDERWMELPLDADGKPWHLGDHNESGDRVRAIGCKTIVYDFEENDCDWAHTRTHESSGELREEIVRCRDCRAMGVKYGNTGIECWMNGEPFTVEPDGFCAWGEKKAVEQ